MNRYITQCLLSVPKETTQNRLKCVRLLQFYKKTKERNANKKYTIVSIITKYLLQSANSKNLNMRKINPEIKRKLHQKQEKRSTRQEMQKDFLRITLQVITEEESGPHKISNFQI
ncbi:hypothetical protein TVAG_034530 [Trichomonas vaginalis G3]|uniref:Uncharacterized protein n=1 Tax=Trichomonas vaginalis (strain ATCC PRA-98 / G3) TaxID=412133 RepID=A2GKD5_TRIV3|nr:hypothetical protein TVAG_034530 [Trichomonas vaginalis G3]|eukprot:XP_001295314.1 hypothetical protein [Trichomonas vaginalis G3]